MTYVRSMRKFALLLGVLLALGFVDGLAFAQSREPQADQGIAEIRKQLQALAFVERELKPQEFLAAEHGFLVQAAKQVLPPSDWRLMIDLALRTWNFERVEAYRRASDVAARLLEDVTLPPNAAGTATAHTPFWELDRDSKALRHADRRIDQGTHFLTVFHPKCSVCKRLIADVERDAAMRAFWQRCATWIGTVEGNFSLEVYGGWARRHPAQSLVFIQDWALIGLQSIFETPIMFVVQDGVIKGKLVGYPPDGAGKAHVAAFLQSHGVDMERGCGR